MARFTIEDIKKYYFRVDGAAGPAPFVVTPSIIELYEKWWEFCKETPVYEEINFRARIGTEVLKKDYLQLCQDYNDLSVQYNEFKQKNKEFISNINTLLYQFPFLNGIPLESIIFLIIPIKAVLQNNLQTAFDEIMHLADKDIPNEYAESYLILAQRVCATLEYAEGWVMFQKELVRFYLDTNNVEKAKEQIKELEELLPDDVEVKELIKQIPKCSTKKVNKSK